MEREMQVPVTRSGVAARLRDTTSGPSLSFELYPPQTAEANLALRGTITRLVAAGPDFFSVTYGASGSSRETSRAVVQWILANTSVTAVAHLTCIGSPREDVRAVAEALIGDGVRDFLALRGDPPAGVAGWRPHPNGLRRASELVELLRELEADSGESLSIGVAATPSALPAAGPAVCDDIQALCAKQDAGADYAISQVFFEVGSYVRYRDAALAAGVNIPLLPGVVPLTDPQRLRRLQEVSGVAVPPSVLQRLDAESDPIRRNAVGTVLGVELAHQVIDAGAPGLHLYTFNQHAATLDLLKGANLGGRGRIASPLAGQQQVTAPLDKKG
jgi:methylenetetrahydrofolate reductase (NADPH)